MTVLTANLVSLAAIAFLLAFIAGLV